MMDTTKSHDLTNTYVHTVCTYIRVYLYYIYACFVYIRICIFQVGHTVLSVCVSMIKYLTINTCARIIHCFVKFCVLCRKTPFLWTYKGTTHCLPTYVCVRYALLQLLLLPAPSGDTHPYVYAHVCTYVIVMECTSLMCMYTRTYPCVHICVFSEPLYTEPSVIWTLSKLSMFLSCSLYLLYIICGNSVLWKSL